VPGVGQADVLACTHHILNGLENAIVPLVRVASIRLPADDEVTQEADVSRPGAPGGAAGKWARIAPIRAGARDHAGLNRNSLGPAPYARGARRLRQRPTGRAEPRLRSSGDPMVAGLRIRSQPLADAVTASEHVDSDALERVGSVGQRSSMNPAAEGAAVDMDGPDC
jgi:hypothetical protein